MRRNSRPTFRSCRATCAPAPCPAAVIPVLGRRYLLGNADLRLAWVQADTSSGIYRNAVGDELVYVQSGRATLESSFGPLPLAPGDYVVIPTGTTLCWVLGGGVLVHWWWRPRGMSPSRPIPLGPGPAARRGAILRARPAGPRRAAAGRGRRGAGLGADPGRTDRHVHAQHPFDVVGWDGCLYPFALSIHDFEPIVGAIHQPPPVHQTFAGPNFVVCSFVPRPFDFFPGAIKVPYHHANVDSDEVLFYSAGDFMSRAGAGIGVGSISLHPAGFVHGPQPGSMERSAEATRTEEVAVMLDAFARLGLSEEARAIADPDYPWTWAQPAP